MNLILKYFKISNLEDELKKLEDKILKKAKGISRYDLQEIENVFSKIAFLRANIE